MAFEIVAIGTSWGGLYALKVVLGGLPKSFPVPLVIVQHRSSNATTKLAEVLQSYSGLRVQEPEEKEPIRPGRVYLAPAGYHMLVEDHAIALSIEAPVRHARPSIDVLFESVADDYGVGAIGVILTGASADGAQGLARIKERGGLTVVEDPAKAESRIMPEAAIRSTAVDHVLPLTQVAPLLIAVCQPGSR
ncbi:MAG TPA: chemotaxis protein CheB [Dehalococcoidia bacterium]|nr:chemotaxis protein CheB [Dehalococcoidia bacterium]